MSVRHSLKIKTATDRAFRRFSFVERDKAERFRAKALNEGAEVTEIEVLRTIDLLAESGLGHLLGGNRS